MLCLRKWRRPIAKVFPVFSFSVLGDSGGYSGVLRKKQAYSCRHSSLYGVVQSPLTNKDMRTIISRISVCLNCHRDLFSTMVGTTLVQARDMEKVSMDMEIAIEGHRFNDAWELCERQVQMEGLPCKSVLNKLLVTSAESLDPPLLSRCFDLIEYVFENGKEGLLEKEPVIYLALCLAKCQLPDPASTILRKLIEMKQYPPVSAWSAILANMSRTPSGACLASKLILEMGYLFENGKVEPCEKANASLAAMKPNTTAANIALGGCLLFGEMRKADQLLDMMPRIQVKVDATLFITVAHMYNRNGQIEELMKLQRQLDEVCNLSDIHFWHFYNYLLSCHLKHGDLVSSSNIVLKMLQSAKRVRNSVVTSVFGFQDGKQFYSGQFSHKNLNHGHGGSVSLESRRSNGGTVISYEDFLKDRNFLKLDSEAKEILDTILAKLQLQVPLTTNERGSLHPNETIYAKLVRAFLEAGKTKQLAELLIKSEKEDAPASKDNSVSDHIINLCITLGWLVQAHYLLDELHLAGVRTSASVYASLLKAYSKQNCGREAVTLLRDAYKAGIQLDFSYYEELIMSQVPQRDTWGAPHLYKKTKDAKKKKFMDGSQKNLMLEMQINNKDKGGHQEFDMLVKGCAEGGEAGLMGKLLREIKEEQLTDSGVHDWNNVIHFFCKKRLMQDAERALKKLKALGHKPNAQTFHSMVTGYAAVGGKYAEVTELWNEMKHLASSILTKFDQELLDSVLYTFVRGGFFARANEVVDMMEQRDMFIDKYKYRTLYLKYHRTLYKGKAPKIQTEKQMEKREAALKFKKWIGLY